MALVYALTTSTFLFSPFPNAGSYIPIDTIDNTHLKNAFVGDHTEVTVATGDSILLGDVNDSGNTKRDTVQGILDLVPASGAKMFVFENATEGASPATGESLNFASWTDNGTGDYTITATSAMANANYSGAGAHKSGSLYAETLMDNTINVLRSTTALRIHIRDGNNGIQDTKNLSYQWLGALA